MAFSQSEPFTKYSHILDKHLSVWLDKVRCNLLSSGVLFQRDGIKKKQCFKFRFIFLHPILKVAILTQSKCMCRLVIAYALDLLLFPRLAQFTIKRNLQCPVSIHTA